jgi:phosphatidylserine synthase
MAQTFPSRTAALLTAVMLIAAGSSWTFFTGWGVTAAYVGSHIGMASNGEIQQAQTRAATFVVELLCAQILLFCCAAKLMALLNRDRLGVIPSLKSLGLGIAAWAVTDILVFGTLLLIQLHVAG